MGFNANEPRVPVGQAGGGRWGAPRDSKAAGSQKDVGGQKSYTQIRSLPPKQRAAFVKGMADGDLKALTAMLYSYPTSDPDVVNARITVANEMAKRGLDVKKYGALGGGLQAVKKQQARAAAVHRATGRSAAPARVTTPPPSGTPRHPGQKPV